MLLQTLLKNLTLIVDSAVIKFNKYAQDGETTESIRRSDYYIAAKTETDNFTTYSEFTAEAIRAAHVPFLDIYSLSPSTEEPIDTNALNITLHDLIMNKELIPEDKRSSVVLYQRQYTIRDYETDGDYNNYYRSLSGFPDLEDVSPLILSNALADKYNAPHDIPIYRHNASVISKMQMNGDLDAIIQANPTQSYLTHLGDRKIDSLAARRANNFSLLYVDSSQIPISFLNTFTTIYEQNREYICTAIYNKHLSNTYEMYDNFIGLCIMFMTIQRVVANAFKQGIQRDLYDWAFIQKLYAAYNIPFIEGLPIDTHMTLIKNFNRLLRYKSTDKVLFDLCALLGYSDITIYKYLLVKNRKFNSDGLPITVKDESGSLVKSSMYDLYFQAVDINETNIAMAIQTPSKIKSYEDVTGRDPYWWDSGDLKATILEDDFNYYNSKYISLNIMYNISEMIFDLTYGMRMFLDNKEAIEENDIRFSLPKISVNNTFTLFDIAVFIIAGMCKIQHLNSGTATAYGGTIVSSASRISHIYGFNFNDATIATINQFITDNSDIIDDDFRTYFSGAVLNVQSADDVNMLFGTIKEYRDRLITSMYNATDIKTYTIYRQLYDISMTTDNVTDMFTLNNGQVATTYLEYLQEKASDLYHTINDNNAEGLYDYISHAVGLIETELDNIDRLHFLTNTLSPAYTALMSLVKFFKSYTVDVESFNIWYLMDSKYYNAIRFFDDIAHIDSTIIPKDSLNFIYTDSIQCNTNRTISGSVSMRESLIVIDNTP